MYSISSPDGQPSSTAFHIGAKTTSQLSPATNPYPLVYSVETALLIKVENRSLWILMDTELEEIELVRTLYGQLNFIEEKTLKTFCYGL